MEPTSRHARRRVQAAAILELWHKVPTQQQNLVPQLTLEQLQNGLWDQSTKQRIAICTSSDGRKSGLIALRIDHGEISKAIAIVNELAKSGIEHATRDFRNRCLASPKCE